MDKCQINRSTELEIAVRIAITVLVLVALPSAAHAHDPKTSAAVTTDQRNATPPPGLIQVRYPTGGEEVPARLFVPAGPGPHPTLLLLHGFPGTELNLDLARAVQRAGWNVMAIHYRGVWGAPGQFSFAHTIEDARAALAWLRQPARVDLVDPSLIVVLGHSMGGFDTVMIGDDAGVAGFVTISAADMGAQLRPLNTPAAREAARTEWAEDVGFTNMSYDAMVDEALANGASWNWGRNAAEMVGRPVLVIDSNDGLEKDGDAIVAAISGAGGPTPTRLKFETDHSYNDQRLALASAVTNWLSTTFPTGGMEGARDDRLFASERSTIQSLRAANNRAIAARDLEGTMAISADDYVLVRGSDPIIRSAEAMKAHWSEGFADPNDGGCVRQPENIEVGQHGGVLRAAEGGRWHCSSSSPSRGAEPHGSYFAHWSKRSGEWRVVSDNYVTLGCRGAGC